MMLLPSDEELKLINKLKECNDDSERQIILAALEKLAIEEDSKMSHCPFEH